MRYNDTTVHSVPVGVNILGSILHMNALKSLNQTPYPLEATILPFPGLTPEWTFDSTSFTSILLIGMSLAIIPGSFAIEVVALRQVNGILERFSFERRKTKTKAGILSNQHCRQQRNTPIRIRSNGLVSR